MKKALTKRAKSGKSERAMARCHMLLRCGEKGEMIRYVLPPLRQITTSKQRVRGCGYGTIT